MEIGTRMLLEFPNGRERLTATLVGMEPSDYFILKVPLTTGIRHSLLPGNQITVRFVSRGRVYGFRSGVIEYLVKPYSLVFLASPLHMETVELRRDHRVDCYFPARVALGETDFKGMLLDISAGGCKVLIDPAQALRARQLCSPQAPVGLRFHALDPQAAYVVDGSVQSIQDEAGHLHLGLRFTDSASTVIEAIDSYVTEVVAALASDGPAPLIVPAG